MHNGDLLSEIAREHNGALQREAEAQHLASAGQASERADEPGIVDRTRRAVAGPLHAIANAVYPRECLD